jgi:coenzyme F420-dependent glucose-6-phosphate dehydrogenase
VTTIGYAAMLEQFHPTDLLEWCPQAEAAGFRAGFMVSEHFHPWTPQQGQSAFAWAFMGALGARTSLPFGTAVTCPGFRYHPAVIAHAAATLGAMYPGRFYLGLGAGEALNEHVIGGEWPEIGVRSAMLFESIEIINKLFSGKVVKHKGDYFTLESARLYTIPPEDQRVPIYVATAGPVNAKRTGKYADGIIEDFAAMAKLVGPDDFKNRVLMTSDLGRHIEHIQHYVDMGFDEIHLHNVGRNQAQFIDVFGREVLPELRLG